MKNYDVAIIGAGLAGLQCARLLGRRGLRVLLADRKRTLDQKVHTTGIFVRRTLEDFDIPTDCLGPPVRHVRLYSPSRRSMDLHSAEDEFRIGRMGKLYGRYLDQCVLAGVDWMPGARYVEYQSLREQVIVRLDGASESQSVRARYLVGADGANSRVGKDLKLDSNREWIVGVEDVLVNVPLSGPPRLHCFLDPLMAPGYLAWIAHDGEEAHVGVGGYSSSFDPTAALDKFRNSLNGIIDLKHAKTLERRGGLIPVGGVLPRIANSQGLLIGDAAGAVSPLTAGGLDPCMRLSSLAAKIIPEYLETQDKGALAAYSGEQLRTRFTSRICMRRVLTQIRGPILIEMACAALRLPLMNWFAWHIFFGRGSFPDVKGLGELICNTEQSV